MRVFAPVPGSILTTPASLVTQIDPSPSAIPLQQPASAIANCRTGVGSIRATVNVLVAQTLVGPVATELGPESARGCCAERGIGVVRSLTPVSGSIRVRAWVVLETQTAPSPTARSLGTAPVPIVLTTALVAGSMRDTVCSLE